MSANREQYIPIRIPTRDNSSMKLSNEISKGDNRFIEMPSIRSSVKRMIDARNQPEIQQLFSMVWQSNELHLLFADTGVGKSILAVALSLSLCRGEGFLGLKNETEKQVVLFYDFELSDRQFHKGYSDDEGNEDPLDENFYTDTLDFAKLSEMAGGFNEQFDKTLFDKIEYDIKNTSATVLVLDNLTYLNTQSTQDTKIALEVMRRLNELKKEYNLSILVLAHTPKRSNQSPLTLNDLAGSKHLSNYADSISAIGKSTQDSSIRYLKQIKPSRSGEMLYDADNVLVCEISKKKTMLTFGFVEFDQESNHIRESYSDSKIPTQMYDVVELLSKGKSYSEIALQLEISKGTITKWKKKYANVFETVVSTVSNKPGKETTETETKLETIDDLPF